jgi:hypothetical protein
MILPDAKSVHSLADVSASIVLGDELVYRLIYSQY